MQKSIKKKKRKGQHISKCGQYFFGQKENIYKSLNSIKLLCVSAMCVFVSSMKLRACLGKTLDF